MDRRIHMKHVLPCQRYPYNKCVSTVVTSILHHTINPIDHSFTLPFSNIVIAALLFIRARGTDVWYLRHLQFYGVSGGQWKRWRRRWLLVGVTVIGRWLVGWVVERRWRRSVIQRGWRCVIRDHRLGFITIRGCCLGFIVIRGCRLGFITIRGRPLWVITICGRRLGFIDMKLVTCSKDLCGEVSEPAYSKNSGQQYRYCKCKY
jgi:hypothetical protein